MKLTENWKALETTVSKIVAKAWIDDEFCKRLIDEPAKILHEAGVTLSESVNVIVNLGSTNSSVLKTADGVNLYEINLPPKPSDLTDEQISSWSKGMVDVTTSCRTCC